MAQPQVVVDLQKAADAFGNYAKLARRLRIPVQTVYGWKRRGEIPSWREAQIIALAKRLRKDVYRNGHAPPPPRKLGPRLPGSR